jgi:hypothetical protein
LTAFETPKPFGQGPTKRRVFISYHHQADQAYYNAFSTTFHDGYEAIFDNSVERKVDSDRPDYVMRRIRENHVSSTSCTLVLVGKNTWGRKYVDWEISATLQKDHGLIGVSLPSAPLTSEGKITVPDRLQDNIQSGYALWATWERWVGFRRQFGGLAKVDSGFDHAASFSVVGSIA